MREENIGNKNEWMSITDFAKAVVDHVGKNIVLQALFILSFMNKIARLAAVTFLYCWSEQI